MNIFKCSTTAVVFCAAIGILGFGCQKTTAPVPATGTKALEPNIERVTAPLSVEEAHDDLIGNWRLDLKRSRSAGLKDVIQAQSKITMVMEPDGSRTLYRDNQPIEHAELVLRTVQPDGKLIGRFTRNLKELPLDVNIEILDESTMQWTFPKGQRTEVFVRQQVEASADFKE